MSLRKNSKKEEIFKKYKTKGEDFYPNIKKYIENKSDNYPCLTKRYTKLLYKKISEVISKENKNNKSFQSLSLIIKTNFSEQEKIFRTEEPEVNQILEGGFKGGNVYKIIGCSGTGKTTLINSIIKTNMCQTNIKILIFCFIYENINSKILSLNESMKSITIVEGIFTFVELLESEYFKEGGEKIKEYDIVILDPFSMILYKGISVDISLIRLFCNLIDELSRKYKICFIFSIYGRKVNNNLFFYKDDKGEENKIILRNYDNYDILPNPQNCVKIVLYKIKKNTLPREFHFMKVFSNNLKNISNLIEWDLEET